MSIEPTYAYVALLDVLAYRFHLEQDRKNGTFVFHDKLNAALSIFNQVNEAEFGVRAISDTIIITCSKHEDFPKFIEILQNVFLAFLKQHLFVRGGIAYSRHFQSGRLTYSHAVARAYELESQHAIYPRIVIDDIIAEMYKSNADLPPIHSNGKLCLENNISFINVLTRENWQEVYDNAKSIYNSSKLDESTISKHIRFERYLLQSNFAPPGCIGYIDRITQI